MQLIIIVTTGGVAPLEVMLDPPLEVVLSSVYVVPPLEVVLDSGLMDVPVGLMYVPPVLLCTVSLV